MLKRKGGRDGRPRRWRAKLLLVFAGTVRGLLACEVCLRLVGFRNLNPYIVDPYVGFSLRPRAEGWWHGEGTTYVRVNSEGLRDRARALRPKSLCYSLSRTRIERSDD